MEEEFRKWIKKHMDKEMGKKENKKGIDDFN